MRSIFSPGLQTLKCDTKIIRLQEARLWFRDLRGQDEMVFDNWILIENKYVRSEIGD